jgi:hypothetical protein
MGWKKFEVGGRILDAIDTTIYRLAMAIFKPHMILPIMG